MEEVKDFWHKYEVPVILVGAAFGIIIFIYANFLTKNDGRNFDMRISNEGEERIETDNEIRQEVKDKLQGIENRQLEDRRILNAILMESRKH